MKVVSKPIQVIVWFDKNGDINPVRFKVENDEDEGRVVKIDRVLKREKEKLAGRVMEKFLCTSCIDGIEKMFEIKYEALSYKWTLFKC